MADAPNPPTGLLKASRDRWKAFWASAAADKVDLQSDMARLVRWIEQTDEYDRVSKVCRKTRLVKGSTGQPVLNPLFAYLNQLEQQISRTEADFGMTPMSRRRLDMPKTADAPPAADTDQAKDVKEGGVVDLTARIARKRGTQTAG